MQCPLCDFSKSVINPRMSDISALLQINLFMVVAQSLIEVNSLSGTCTQACLAAKVHILSLDSTLVR